MYMTYLYFLLKGSMKYRTPLYSHFLTALQTLVVPKYITYHNTPDAFITFQYKQNSVTYQFFFKKSFKISPELSLIKFLLRLSTFTLKLVSLRLLSSVFILLSPNLLFSKFSSSILHSLLSRMFERYQQPILPILFPLRSRTLTFLFIF